MSVNSSNCSSSPLKPCCVTLHTTSNEKYNLLLFLAFSVGAVVWHVHVVCMVQSFGMHFKGQRTKTLSAPHTLRLGCEWGVRCSDCICWIETDIFPKMFWEGHSWGDHYKPIRVCFILLTYFCFLTSMNLSLPKTLMVNLKCVIYPFNWKPWIHSYCITVKVEK